MVNKSTNKNIIQQVEKNGRAKDRGGVEERTCDRLQKVVHKEHCSRDVTAGREGARQRHQGRGGPARALPGVMTQIPL